MKKFVKYMLLFLIGAVIFLLFNRFLIVNGRYYDIRLPGEGINPTSYVFDFSKAEVLRVIDSCFDYHYRTDSSFSPPKTIYTPCTRNVRYYPWDDKSDIRDTTKFLSIVDFSPNKHSRFIGIFRHD